MKINRHLAALSLTIGCLFTPLSTRAGSQHADHQHADHQHAVTEIKAGPNGGRLIRTVEPNAEFFVKPDRYAQITFLDADGQIVAPSGQVVSLVGGDRSNPIKVSFAAVDGLLRSASPLPDQPNMPIILSIKSTSDAKAVRERFYLNQSICGGCDYEEYACTCGH